MNPFGNIDEPYPPAWFQEHWPRLPSRWLRFMWYVRNPLHNFTHYMVGWKGRAFVVERSKPDSNNDGFCDGGGWMFCWLRLDWAGMNKDEWSRPFISYVGRCHFYAGWHPASGKLGLRLTR